MTRLEKVMQGIKLDSELFEPHQITTLGHNLRNGLIECACIRAFGMVEPKCAEQEWTCRHCWNAEAEE